MRFPRPVMDIIRERVSVRTYDKSPIDPGKEKLLRDFFSSGPAGPFGTKSRFELITARPGDAEALAEAICEVLGNPDRYRRGSEDVARRFSSEAVAEQYERLYQSLGRRPA